MMKFKWEIQRIQINKDRFKEINQQIKLYKKAIQIIT